MALSLSKVISGLHFGHYLHLTNKDDPGILEIIIVTSGILVERKNQTC